MLLLPLLAHAPLLLRVERVPLDVAVAVVIALLRHRPQDRDHGNAENRRADDPRGQVRHDADGPSREAEES
eukprot:10936290-Alexandrium_andersonii.AAC.1